MELHAPGQIARARESSTFGGGFFDQWYGPVNAENDRNS